MHCQTPRAPRLCRMRRQARHATLCAGVLGSVLTLLSMQACQRVDTATGWAPVSLASAAYLPDCVFRARVKSALLHSPVQHSIYIGVDVRQGVVLLSGRVDRFVFIPGMAYAAMAHARRDEGIEPTTPSAPDALVALLSSPLPAGHAGASVEPDLQPCP